MSTLSSLPGRLRLQIQRVINNKYYHRMLISRTDQIEGVTQVDVSYRTGRMLVIFDVLAIDSQTLILKITEILDELEHCRSVTGISEIHNNNGRNNEALVRAVIDIVGHIFMPKPLNILLPIALKALRG